MARFLSHASLGSLVAAHLGTDGLPWVDDMYSGTKPGKAGTTKPAKSMVAGHLSAATFPVLATLNTVCTSLGYKEAIYKTVLIIDRHIFTN